VIAELDFAHLGLRIAIEVDGRAFHSDRHAFEHDRWRQNALMVGGWLVLRFTWEQLSERPSEVIALIRAAVARRAA
jgi:very-short-patch-repair endonuclease